MTTKRNKGQHKTLGAHRGETKADDALPELNQDLGTMQNEELIRTKEELESSQVRYFDLYNQAPIGYCTLSEQGLILEVNLTAATMLGRSRGALVKQSFRTLIFKDDQDIFFLLRKQLFETISVGSEPMEEIKEDKLRLVKPDGAPFWVHLKVVAAQAEDGAPLCRMVLIDITERKQAEEALKESEERFKSLHNASFGGICIHDKGKILECNQGLSEMMGYSQEELIGMDGLMLIAQNSRDLVFSNILSGYEKPYEAIGMRKNGELFPMRIEARNVPYKGRNVRTVEFRDITESKQAEEALRENEARQNAMIANISDVIGIIGIDDFMKYKSPNIEKWFGWQPNDLVGTNGWLTVHADDLERIQKEFAILLEKDKSSKTVEYKYKCKDGSYKPIKLTATNLVHDPLIGGVLLNYHDISERKQTEDELRRSEKGLRESQRIAKVGSWRLDVATNQVVWTKELYNMYGFDPSLPPPPYTEHMKLFTPESWERLSTSLAHTRETGIPYTLELETIRKDGSNGWMWVQGEADLDSTGKTVALWGAAQDITERKQAEEQLRQAREKAEVSEARYRLIADNTVDSIWVMDADFHFTYLSPSTEKLFGYSLLEWETLVWSVFVHPGYVEKVVTAFGELKTGKEQIITTLAAPVRHKNGREMWVEFSAAGIFDENNLLTEVVGITRDITEGKLAEKQLKESEENFKSLMQQSPFVVELYDLNGLQISVNKAYEELWGFPVDTTLNKFNVLESKEVEETGLLEYVKRAYAGESVLVPEYFFDPTGNTEAKGVGRRRWLSSRIYPLKDETEKVKNIVIVHQDITDRKQAELERENLQAQLNQAQKMESVGRLAGGVAHDFNNMLGVILGHTEMALEELDPSLPLYESLQEVFKAAKRSAILTRQLLAFARKQTISPKVVGLNETVEGMLSMLRRLIGEDIDLLWKPGHGLGPVMIDPSQIDQLLANLCVNARDAITDVGKVTIETGNADFDEDYCVWHAGFVPGEFTFLVVSDDGCGMDKETLANIFEPFFTTKDLGKGTGLGLATVYGIVKQNNGFINVYSEPGKGTAFNIYLPRQVAGMMAETKEAKTQAVAHGSETILLVEDEAAILRMTTLMLESLGYRVLAAPTPGEAILLAKEYAGQIDLLVTDVVMPEMNGRDLGKMLQATYPALKQLFMSGYTANVIAHHGVLDPGVSFIQKPFSMQDLGAKIAEVLGNGE